MNHISAVLKTETVLIIEAHSDDSAISASGFMEKFRHAYTYHFLLMACSDIHLYHCGLVSREERLKEYENYVHHFNGIWHRTETVPFDADSRMDTLPRNQVVAAIEQVISEVRPQILICQGPSFHHDHVVVYEATIAATRPTARFCPKEIYIAENPTYVHTSGAYMNFKPDFFVSLSEAEIDKKIEWFKTFFPSQIRDSGNYLSPKGIKSWAHYRGIESRCEYAEAFKTFIRVI